MSSPDLRGSHLRQLLATLAPADSREAAYRERMQGLLEAPGDPFDRNRFDPGHFTASAFVLSPARDALLMVLHGKLRRWLQPGGHVDAADPDLIATARREVEEETAVSGLALVNGGILDVDVHRIPPLLGSPAHEHFDVRFLFASTWLDVQAGSDAKSTRWVPLTSVNAVESDDSVMRAVAKL